MGLSVTASGVKRKERDRQKSVSRVTGSTVEKRQRVESDKVKKMGGG